jgi:DNA-binding NtrC family response regulator
VRELASVLRHGVIMAESPSIQIADLPPYLVNPPRAIGVAGGAGDTLEHARALGERQLVEATLQRFGGNQSAAAAALGVDRKTLYNKLRQYRRGSSASGRAPGD